MNRRFLILLIAPAALLTLSAHAKDSKQDDAKVNKVTIKNLKYEPAEISVKTGETVVWTNKDDNDHTVTGDNGGPDDAFKSDNLGSGDKFNYTFAKKGKYKYHCKYHPRMKGTVTVQD
jgi:plastocyanin